jgi:hypothetical protein
MNTMKTMTETDTTTWAAAVRQVAGAVNQALREARALQGDGADTVPVEALLAPLGGLRVQEMNASPAATAADLWRATQAPKLVELACALGG